MGDQTPATGSERGMNTADEHREISEFLDWHNQNSELQKEDGALFRRVASDIADLRDRGYTREQVGRQVMETIQKGLGQPHENLVDTDGTYTGANLMVEEGERIRPPHTTPRAASFPAPADRPIPMNEMSAIAAMRSAAYRPSGAAYNPSRTQRLSLYSPDRRPGHTDAGVSRKPGRGRAN